MTNLAQAPYPLIATFFSRIHAEMSRQGVTAEQIEALMSAPKQFHEWVDALPEISPSRERLSLERVFPDDPALVRLFTRQEIYTLGELVDCTVEELRGMWQLGDVKFAKVIATVEGYGMQLSKPINNGARRIRYADRDRKDTVRRDQLGGKRISDFVRIEQDPTRNQRDRNAITFDEFRAASTDMHRRLFSDFEIDTISTWIAVNVVY